MAGEIPGARRLPRGAAEQVRVRVAGARRSIEQAARRIPRPKSSWQLVSAVAAILLLAATVIVLVSPAGRGGAEEADDRGYVLPARRDVAPPEPSESRREFLELLESLRRQ